MMSKRLIRVVGAREHNLKNISVDIPKDLLVVITGPSGSGKSSLALDILFTEGKRRYTESLSSYARQFLGIARKPKVDTIEGLCPAIAIEQKTVGHNPRSTVGTITEIYDYMRVLFARVGVVHCSGCSVVIGAHSPASIALMLVKRFVGNTITIVAPLARQQKGEFKHQLSALFEKGYYRYSINGKYYKFTSIEEIKSLVLGKTYRHTIDLLLDTVAVDAKEKARLTDDLENAATIAQSVVKVIVGDQSYTYAFQRICLHCARSFPDLEPRFFSFNSPVGACKDCSGLGMINQWPWKDDDPEAWKAKYPDFFSKYAKVLTCRACLGRRLNDDALAVTIGDKNIFEIGEYSITKALSFFNSISLDDTCRTIATPLLSEIISRLTFLHNVGLTYLTLNRSARTLSGGEGQRIRLATQIGSSLSGVLYILDEPSIGLHQRDNDRLIQTVKRLRDQGNTVIVVEHDIDTIRASDYVIDMGPEAGVKGGLVTAVGTPEEIEYNEQSLTGAYLSRKKYIAVPRVYRIPTQWLKLKHARTHNLKDLSVSFPLGVLCGISGVSGSGKSTLIMEELVPALERSLNTKREESGDDDLHGYEHLQSIVVIDQSPIGRTSRSNPATYLGLFDDIRRLFAQLPESNARGYKPGRFSFNVVGGRCDACRGDGTITVSMHFLADVMTICKICKGKRYNQDSLDIVYKGKNIADILAMSAYEACGFFKAHYKIVKRLSMLCDVGLEYLTLGQPSTTLSGGEAQRIKLVGELAKRGTKTLYILDEPTTGLHNSDIDRLLIVLNKLVDKDNSVIVIEHNVDVLKTVDYLIDLGPEGGEAGGQVVAMGTPQQVAKQKKGHTCRYLYKAFCESDLKARV